MAVAERVFDLLLGPGCRDAVENSLRPLGNARRWAAYLAGVHDLGKFTPTFQALRADLALEAFGEEADGDIRWLSRFGHLPRTDTPHGLMTAVHLGGALEAWGASRPVARAIATVLGGHHGFFPDAASIQRARDSPGHHGKAKWSIWRDRMLRDLALLHDLPDPGTLPWGDVRFGLDFGVALAALTTISDWIASDERNFPYASKGIDLVAYARRSGEQAESAVAKLAWQPWSPPEDTGYRALFDEDPRPVQQRVEELVGGSRGPVLLLVEAPTGEGKTKAALQAVAALARRLGCNGAYVAMPTRATSKQTRDVFGDLLRAHGDPSRVHLVHSTADQDPRPSEVGVDSPEPQDDHVREWFVRSKNLLVPLGVGTVDQLLKAAFRSRFGFVRLGGLSGKVVVLDEVHAYDTFMSTLIDRLLAWLGHLGVPVVLLSATLPAARRAELVAAWRSGALDHHPTGVPAAPDRDPYPRITLAGVGGPVRCEPASVSELNAEREVRLHHIPEDEVVERALAWCRGTGGSVAVIHNLVRRAEDTARRVEEAVHALPEEDRPEVLLIHAKLDPPARRQEVEARLRAAFGPGGTRKRAVVVGTQVLEQSLDLDFDAMITDLAPVDSLVQRLGRLRRHRRDGELLAAVTGVEDAPTGPEFPPGTHKVYAQMVLLRTWAVLRDSMVLRCPDEVPALIDEVYGDGPACPPGWELAWREAEERMARAREKRKVEAEERYLPFPGGPTRIRHLTTRPGGTGDLRKKGPRA